MTTGKSFRVALSVTSRAQTALWRVTGGVAGIAASAARRAALQMKMLQALHQWRELKRYSNYHHDDELSKLGKDVSFLTDRISRLTYLVEAREQREREDCEDEGGGGGGGRARGASATAVLERRMAVQEKIMRRMARQLEALTAAAKKKK